MRKLLIIIILASQTCFAQKKKQGSVGAMVNYVLSKNMNRDALMDSPKGTAYFFTIALVFNGEGKIDTALFSKQLDHKTATVMGLNASLVKKIKEQQVTYTTFASKVVVVPLFFFRATDAGIDYSTGFVNAIQNLLPGDDPLFWGKPQVIVDPVINPFVEHH
ncbi:hypothetical protein ACQKCH_12665 [Nubsella zeaxanthinifaciens]|uniref:hypothetical protein n=1 Tax=Nubsella zeaxanthinifaciens TaxID=392412 RepID=UPI003D00ECE6